jgi:hypothetical protein
LRLIENMLNAGYLEEWKWHATYSGSPQGGVISPILSNIYLDRLDKYVMNTLIPETSRGEERADNGRYRAISRQIYKAKKNGNRELYWQLVQQRRTMPSLDPNDPDFRRLRYVRYADDFLLSFIGPKVEAERIKQQLQRFLYDELNLELSSDKTLITHAKEEAARFLSYEIRAEHVNDKLTNNRRSINGVITLIVPRDIIAEKRMRYMRNGEPIHRAEMLNDSDYDIINKYQLEYRGIVQYYILARNVAHLSYLRITMQTSLIKTLAAKHKMSAKTVYAQYSATHMTPYGTHGCLKTEVTRKDKPPLVAIFDGIPLRRRKISLLVDLLPKTFYSWRQTDAVKRMLADTCELCGVHGDCQVHHIHRMNDLHKKGQREKPEWMKQMIAKRRKTLVVCRRCHHDIHHPPQHGLELESRMP